HVDGIADCTYMYNTANIYFDFNPPIATNTTMNTMVLVIPTGIQSPGSSCGISVFPNPVDQEAVFDLGSYRGNCRLEIWNSAGQRVLSEELLTQQYHLAA